jgi:hypothetical protein
MAYTTIDDPSAHFTVKTYTGTGSTNAITNDANAGNFKPDWLWIKQRNTARSHRLINSSFFSTYLASDNDGAEASNDVVNSLDTNGFTLSTPASVNQSSGTYVAWQWKANGGTTSSNTDGDITTTVQTNSTAGFSIITYTGNGNNLDTIGHGLGATPDFAVVKGRTGDNTKRWFVKIPAVCGNSEILEWDTTNAKSDSGNGIETMGSSTITLGIDTGNINSTNENTKTYVCYAFKNIQGYSKIGSYKGNGNADGPFVYTGFKPAWVMAKRTSNADKWFIWDIKRDTFNVMDTALAPSETDADNTDTAFHLDMLSNGFKLKSTFSAINLSGDTYIYMAFAEHPFVSSKGVPVTAR